MSALQLRRNEVLSAALALMPCCSCYVAAISRGAKHCAVEYKQGGRQGYTRSLHSNRPKWGRAALLAYGLRPLQIGGFMSAFVVFFNGSE